MIGGAPEQTPYCKSRTYHNLEIAGGLTPPLKINKGGSAAFVSGHKHVGVCDNEDHMHDKYVNRFDLKVDKLDRLAHSKKKLSNSVKKNIEIQKKLYERGKNAVKLQGRLRLTVVEAILIRDTDILSEMDPYVTIHYDGNVYKT